MFGSPSRVAAKEKPHHKIPCARLVRVFRIVRGLNQVLFSPCFSSPSISHSVHPVKISVFIVSWRLGGSNPGFFHFQKSYSPPISTQPADS
jgi:hypothetical protein